MLISLLILGFLPGLPFSVRGQENGREQALSPRRVLENLKAETYSGKRIDLIFSNVGLQEILAEIQKASGFPPWSTATGSRK